MSDRVLVTGGAGFLGSHLCRRLVEAGRAVTCLDDFSTGRRVNVEPLMDHPRFALVEADVAEPIDARSCRDVGEIYNLACPASPMHYQRDPVGTTRTNVLGALNVLDLARRLGCPVLQASTSEVYGDPAVHPQREDYKGNVNPIGPRACYDEGKRCAESLFFDHRRQLGTAIRVARIFNTFGPHMSPHDGRVVSSFVVAALRGEPLNVHGDGGQTRSFCYVDDMIEGLTALMAAPDAVTGPVNLGNPHEVSMIDLAERVIALTGSRSGIAFAPLPTDDPARRCPDIARAGAALGWRPRTPLDEGLARTIAHFEGVLRAS